ncbi:gephyrin-like molybdotransferase Glp [uncultured Tateyamaria sp.]|uniref:molybdopterin-binding protein n=1 Tax=uncultured Tateyamaria sp. TaxID=455651 RepID=UPI002615766F|nr:gephyrin-like molybdotransferase Glp [uncultured Tateyamaria sp.]
MAEPMPGFDKVIIVDWSASKTPSRVTPSADAIWIAVAENGTTTCTYHRTRADAVQTLCRHFDAALDAGQRVLAGFDFPFGYPAGFGRVVAGSDDPLVLWETLADRIEDADNNANNRFDVARMFNRQFPGVGPFWGCPEGLADDDLPTKGTARHGHGLPERRQVETRIASAQPCWKLFTTGSVGSQALLGIARLQGLRARYGATLSVSPFEVPDTPIVLAEIYPSMLAPDVAARQGPDEIKDRAQVRVLADAFAGVAPDALDAMLREGDRTEGWILGLGHEDVLRAALGDAPVPLRNDCFALPPGVDWTPVDTALADLRARLGPVVGQADVAVADALGRVLARDVVARRAHPPLANTAVDGYGFMNGRGPGPHQISLVAADMAAGAVPDTAVPAGTAIRILTGAALPPGVDTVILQEDVSVADGAIRFVGPIRQGANTRKAGEDVQEGAVVLSRGRRLTAADLALLSAVGVAEVAVHAQLRVGVLSTGDELVPAGAVARPGQIHDANRPMLMGLIAQMGHVPVDLGCVPDDRAALRARLDAAAGAQADVILTSGGASAGDHDHVSALLTEAGAMALWRIAIKPGRPLALGMWQGVPVFGLPGNPVAAMVCTLVFAGPALAQMAGAAWRAPQGFDVPAGFTKSKKAGRREYLRARMRDGRAEVFASEGSGRISGLSWAEGLVELPDAAAEIAPGDPVRFIPWGGFGI